MEILQIATSITNTWCISVQKYCIALNMKSFKTTVLEADWWTTLTFSKMQLFVWIFFWKADIDYYQISW